MNPKFVKDLAEIEKKVQKTIRYYNKIAFKTKEQKAYYLKLVSALEGIKPILSNEVEVDTLIEENSCVQVDKVFPPDTVTEFTSSNYQSVRGDIIIMIMNHIKDVNEQMFYIKKIRSAAVYFVKADNTGCFAQINNLWSCRLVEANDGKKKINYQYICLYTGKKYKVLNLYTAKGNLLGNSVIARKALFEPKIEEDRLQKKSVQFEVKNKIDFLVKKITIKELPDLTITDFQKPVLVNGVYKHINNLNKFTRTITDSRPAYRYDGVKNHVLSRKITFIIQGWNEGEEVIYENQLVGMQKIVHLSFTEMPSIAYKLTIKPAGNIDFNKWYLTKPNGEKIRRSDAPSVVEGGGLINYGLGAPKGIYKFSFVENKDEKTPTYEIDKKTNNGYISLFLDLGNFVDLNWDDDLIIGKMETCEGMIKDAIQDYLLGKLIELMETIQKQPEKSDYVELVKLGGMASTLITVASGVVTVAPYVSIIASLVTTVSNSLKELYITEEKARKQIEVNRLIVEIKGIRENFTRKFDEKINKSTADVRVNRITKYYQQKTKGKTTTGMILKDMELTYKSLLPKALLNKK